MAYRKKTSGGTTWWINDLESVEKTISLKITSADVYTVAEGDITGGSAITQTQYETVTDALVGHDTELGIMCRVGTHPPPH